MIKHPLLKFPIASAALILGLSACTGGSNPSTPPAVSETAAGALELEMVQALTAPRFQTDPNCAYGEWSENSTGIDKEFRDSATTIQQFDCYQNQNQVGGIPTRTQQSIFVEFSDSSVAKSFAEDQSVLYLTLVAGPSVVVAGSGLETVDMRAYLTHLQTECACGEILGPAQ